MNSQSQWQVVSCKCCLYSVQIISLSVKYTIFYKIAVIVIIKIQNIIIENFIQAGTLYMPNSVSIV